MVGSDASPPRRDNAGDHALPYDAGWDLVADMAAFDRLPPDLRQALRDAPLDVSAASVLGIIQAHGATVARCNVEILLGLSREEYRRQIELGCGAPLVEQ